MDMFEQFLWDYVYAEPKKVSSAEPKEISTITPLENTKVIEYDEIAAIEYEYGKIEDGSEVNVDLRTLLKICPRRRPRADAYKGLISKIKKERNATLIIKSQKNR